MRRAIVAAPLVALLAGCQVGTTDPVDAGPPARGLPAATGLVYLVRDGVVTPVSRPGAVEPMAALALLEQGPWPEEGDILTSALPPGIRFTALRSPPAGEPLWTVEVADGAGGLSELALTQVACTVLAYVRGPDLPPGQVSVADAGVHRPPVGCRAAGVPS